LQTALHLANFAAAKQPNNIMAKAATKSATPKAAPKKAAVKKAATVWPVDQACVQVLEKLKELDTEHQLQADIQWCLGSYTFDHNPVGLYEIVQRAIEIFNAHKARKTKGVTAKFIGDLEAVLKAR
jgi:hypothetical protein